MSVNFGGKIGGKLIFQIPHSA